MGLLDLIRNAVKAVMRKIAGVLNSVTDGKLSPNAVTIAGFLAHIPIAYLIARQHTVLAAVLLVFFGLFDTLDGELARLQKRASPIGMLLDSVTDRMKEILIYVGITALLVETGQYYTTILAVGALGASMCTTYINAWGDVVMTAHKSAGHAINKTIRGGFLPFEIRMTLLVAALLSSQLKVILTVILVLATFTAFERLLRVIRKLKDV